MYVNKNNNKYNFILLNLVLLFLIPAAPSVNNDIALLKLSRPVRVTDHVSVICLPDDDVIFPEGTQCQLAGWGVTDTGRVHS